MMPIVTSILLTAMSGWSTSASAPTLLAGGTGEQVQPKQFFKIHSEFEAHIFRLCYCNAADLLCWYVPPAPVVIAAPQWKCDNCGRNLCTCPCRL